MDAQPAGSFDKKAFIAAVKAAIEAEVTEESQGGRRLQGVRARPARSRARSRPWSRAASRRPPRRSRRPPRHRPTRARRCPSRSRRCRRSSRASRRRSPPAAAVPKPAPPDQLNLAAGANEANREMAEADVTDQQLAESNEPQFEGAAAAKREAAAPRQDRARPTSARRRRPSWARPRPRPTSRPAPQPPGSTAPRRRRWPRSSPARPRPRARTRPKRAEVTTKVQNDLRRDRGRREEDPRRPRPQGRQGVRDGREGRPGRVRDLRRDQDGPRTRRTGTAAGSAACAGAKDKLLGMPAKVNEFFDAGRELYLKEMDKVISRVADIVAADLSAAKTRIAKGRTEIAEYVKGLPKDLQKVGAQASTDIGEQFAKLESDVNAKQEALVDTLASKYVESRKGLDDRIEALQAENKGLVDKAIGAIKAVINTIRELAAMLRNVFARAAGVVGSIIKAPGEVPRQSGRRGQGRHPQVQGQHPHAPEEGADGMADGLAGPGRDRAARVLRPQGHPQAAAAAVRPDLGEHPGPAGALARRAGGGVPGEVGRDLHASSRRRGRGRCGRCSSRRSATSRT